MTRQTVGNEERDGDLTVAGDLSVSGSVANPTITGVASFPDGSASAPSVTNDGDTNTGLFFPAADAVAVATGGTERLRVDSNGLITGTGTSLGAWTSWTPTLSGTGWAIGNGTMTARYCQIGKIVFARLSINMGSTTTYGAAALTISLPVTAATSSSGAPISTGDAFDASASSLYQVRARLASTTTVVVTTFASPLGYVTDAGPFTWANTDQLNLKIAYEAA